MKILLCRPRGFCAGVVRAIEVVEKALEIWGPPIYVKHEIVHNRHVVEGLIKKGAIFVDEIEQVPSHSRLVYSAHGVAPSVRKEALEKQLFEIDATCGLVTKVHSAAKRFASKGYELVLIGHKNHVETIGTAGEAPEKTTIVENLDDVHHLSFPKDQKLAYLTQTTLSLDDVKLIVTALKEKYPSIETIPSSSICYATTNRQMALKSIVHQCDLVLVVGDPTSSNSNRLREVAENRGVEAYLINDPSEIQFCWLEGKTVIGMTAGASTPESIVGSCLKKLQKLGAVIEEVDFVKEDVVFQLPKVLMQHETAP